MKKIYNSTHFFFLGAFISEIIFIAGKLQSLTSIDGGPPLQDSPLIETWAAVGKDAFLPCNITAPFGDSPQLIIFYKGLHPIYSVDARSETLRDATHWVSKELNLPHLRFQMEFPSQGLLLRNVQPKEDDEYHCRVDFHDSPTRNLRVRLNVAVPPSNLVIRNEAGREVGGVIGPYKIGGLLKLSCEAHEGRPRPVVRWWHDSSILSEDIGEVTHESTDDVVRSTVIIRDLSRNHLLMLLICRASTLNMTRDLEASIKIDMTLPPSEILILGTENPLRAGWTYDITCEVWGSKPPPAITWWRDNGLIQSEHQLSVDVNVTRSKLEIIPKRSDNHAKLTCRAQNELLPAAGVIEASKEITVLYPPEVSLSPGRQIDLKDIEEGDDVYFECEVEANPASHHITWFRDTEELRHDIPSRVLRSGLSLVLQKVTRHSAGNYVCVSSNTVASSTSNEVFLQVKYRPVCAPNQKMVYGGGRRKPVNVDCLVEATPLPLSFRWAFNTTTETVDLPAGRAKSSGRTSTVTYQPQIQKDFGSLLCWGINEVGEQKEPCVFQVVPAGPPEQPRNCTAWQEAAGSNGEVIITCEPGKDGGLPQHFSLEVLEHPSGTLLLALVSRPTPRFKASTLRPGTEYLLRVTSSNAQGKSFPTAFIYMTPIDIAEGRMSASAANGVEEETFIESESLIAIIAGIVAALFVTSGILILVLKLKGVSRPRHHVTRIHEDKMKKSYTQEETIEARDPDVILASDESTSGNSKDFPKTTNTMICSSAVVENTDKEEPSHVRLLPLSVTSPKTCSINPSFSSIIPSNICTHPSPLPKQTMSYHVSTLPASVSAASCPPQISPPPKFSTPYRMNTLQTKDSQPLLLIPPLPPSTTIRGHSRIGGSHLSIAENISPPEEFSSRGQTSWGEEEKESRLRDNSESVV